MEVLIISLYLKVKMMEAMEMVAMTKMMVEETDLEVVEEQQSTLPF